MSSNTLVVGVRKQTYDRMKTIGKLRSRKMVEIELNMVFEWKGKSSSEPLNRVRSKDKGVAIRCVDFCRTTPYFVLVDKYIKNFANFSSILQSTI